MLGEPTPRITQVDHLSERTELRFAVVMVIPKWVAMTRQMTVTVLMPNTVCVRKECVTFSQSEPKLVTART